MASAMAAAAAHSMPPFPLPAVPRIRPPPIPKGTPGPNTLPMPQREPPKSNLVWVDGRWAHPRSKSAKNKREVVSKQLEKALQHEVHGMNIYAYRHLQTNQVVYSLTKNMDNNRILKQLVFHGKKTVPAALRRDMWRPYFSIHFPKTPAGAYKGLLVYRELRELSLKRQLDPPAELKYTREADVENFRTRLDPLKLKEKTEQTTDGRGDKYKHRDLPVPGQKVPASLLAKRLMNQRRTSVADVAAVLMRWAVRIRKGETVPAPSPELRLANLLKHRQKEAVLMSANRAARLNKVKRRQEAKQEELEAREEYLSPRPGYVNVDKHTLARISTEYDGSIGLGQDDATELDMLKQRDEATLQTSASADNYAQALAEVEAEKEARREQVEQEESDRIEQELSKLTETERQQIQKDVEAQRATAQQQIDTQITKAKEKMKQDKEKMHKVVRRSGSKNLEALAALRHLQRERPREIMKMKIDLHNKLLKWLGPFAEITTKVENAMAEIDQKHAQRLDDLLKAIQDHEAELKRDSTSHQVEIRWADIRDGTYAQDWPDSVNHGELQPKAVVQYNTSTVRQQFHLDETETPIQEQKASNNIPLSNSVHVFGTEVLEYDNSIPIGRYIHPEVAAENAAESREKRIAEWTRTSTVLIRDKIVHLRGKCASLEQNFIDSPLDSDKLPQLSHIVEAIASARGSLEELAEKAYETHDLTYIESLLTYARDYLPNARLEVSELVNDSFADISHEVEEARLDWIEQQAKLIHLESHNREAMTQANLREEFLAKFDQRDTIIQRIRDYEPGAPHSNQEMYNAAVADLGRFDREAPFIVDIILRRQDLETQTEDLEQQIRDQEEHITTLSTNTAETPVLSESEASTSTTSSELEAAEESLATLQKQLSSVLDEHDQATGDLRDDKTAWLEFKERGGMQGYLGSTLDADLREQEQRRKREGGQSEDQSKQDEDDEVVVVGQRSLWGRVKGLFRRQ